MRRLFVLRHAKSDWGEPSLPDHDRPLNGRGRGATERLAAYCARARVRPDLVLCSTAIRARETLAGIVHGLGLHAKVSYRPSLYGADAASLERVVRGLDPAIGSAMIVGHNPGLQDLVLMMAGRGDAIERVRAKYPTGALATIDFAVEAWSAAAPGTGRLARLVTPRDLEG